MFVVKFVRGLADEDIDPNQRKFGEFCQTL